MSNMEVELIPGRDVTLSENMGSGIYAQTAATLTNTATFNAHGDMANGILECWVVRAESAADVAYDAAGAIANVFGATKQVRTGKYRILRIDVVLRALRTSAGTADHDVKVQKGNGAASESFSDVVASVDIDGYTINVPTNQTVVVAQTLLATGETLRCQLAVSGSTNGGNADVEFHIYAIPTIA
jgi:hypothetical protein